VVSTFWGEAKEAKDIQSVKFDELHSSPQSDSVQHHLLKAFAGEKPVVEMGKAVEKRPEIFSVREEAANTPVLASVPEAIEKPNTKEPKAQGMEGIPDTLPMAPSSVMESADSVLKTESAPLHAEISPAKLHAQVLPQVQDLAEKGGGKMTLQLDPPEMGRLTIEVTTRGKNVELAIHADSEATRSVLEGGLADLRFALQAQDLQLTHAEVQRTNESSFSSLQFGQGNSEKGQQDSSKEGNPFFGREEKNWPRSFFQESPVARNRNAGRLDFRV
jgi:flagellar hook-length control protein FliK